MLRDIDHFYLQKEEPVKSCLIALREIISNRILKSRLPGNTVCLFSVTREKCFAISGCTR